MLSFIFKNKKALFNLTTIPLSHLIKLLYFLNVIRYLSAFTFAQSSFTHMYTRDTHTHTQSKRLKQNLKKSYIEMDRGEF